MNNDLEKKKRGGSVWREVKIFLRSKQEKYTILQNIADRIVYSEHSSPCPQQSIVLKVFLLPLFSIFVVSS